MTTVLDNAVPLVRVLQVGNGPREVDCGDFVTACVVVQLMREHGYEADRAHTHVRVRERVYG